MFSFRKVFSPRRVGGAGEVSMKDEERFCSFCGKGESQVKRMIAGPNGLNICDECVEICTEEIKSVSSAPSDKVELKKTVRDQGGTG